MKLNKFYSNGVLQETYYIEDLVRDRWEVHKFVTKARWLNLDKEITQEQNILTFETVDGIIYNFN
ncbi:MAG: hypothetical protein GX383_01960 [Clostridium sp.]|jgi:hypothetical protein|nr:hypothetical protein [Clostridium sp.]